MKSIDVSEKRPVGRPKIDLDIAFHKIQPYLQLGYPFHKACLMGEVADSTLYPYYMNDEEFRKRCDREKGLPGIMARRNLVNAINNGDTKISVEWLERVEGEDFAKVQKIEDITPVEEGVILLREIIATRRKIKAELPPEEGQVAEDYGSENMIPSTTRGEGKDKGS